MTMTIGQAVVVSDVAVVDEAEAGLISAAKRHVRRKTSLYSISSNRARNVSDLVEVHVMRAFRF